MAQVPHAGYATKVAAADCKPFGGPPTQPWTKDLETMTVVGGAYLWLWLPVAVCGCCWRWLSMAVVGGCLWLLLSARICGSGCRWLFVAVVGGGCSWLLLVAVCGCCLRRIFVALDPRPLTLDAAVSTYVCYYMYIARGSVKYCISSTQKTCKI